MFEEKGLNKPFYEKYHEEQGQRNPKNLGMAQFVKGDIVKLRSGFNKGKVGEVIKTNKSTVPNSDMEFATVRTLSGGLIHGTNPDAYVRHDPTRKEQEVLHMRTKLRKHGLRWNVQYKRN